MMTPKEIARHITKVAEGKVDWTKAPCELWIEREINEYVQQQVNSVDLANVVNCSSCKYQMSGTTEPCRSCILFSNHTPK
jgi:hypothetical protein